MAFFPNRSGRYHLAFNDRNESQEFEGTHTSMGLVDGSTDDAWTILIDRRDIPSHAYHRTMIRQSQADAC